MARANNKRQRKNILESTSTVITLVGTLVAFSTAAAYFANNYVKNAEILDIKNAFNEKEMTYRLKVYELEKQNIDLKYQIKEYERKFKKK